MSRRRAAPAATDEALRRDLIPHGDSPFDLIERLEVEARRPGPGRLALCFRLHASMAELAVPARTASARADNLWRNTCFEAFLKDPDADAYVEINLSPSTCWALYEFSSYREGMRTAVEARPPAIAVRSGPRHFELAAEFDLGPLPLLDRLGPWRFAPCAVIEPLEGPHSYWAFTHRKSQPDFHDPDGFALSLPLGELL